MNIFIDRFLFFMFIGVFFLLLGGCSMLKPGPRGERYEDCSVRLKREGFTERGILKNCTEAHGSSFRNFYVDSLRD